MWVIGIWISGILIEDYLLPLFGGLEEMQDIVTWSLWQSQEAHPMIARIQNQGWEELPSKYFPRLFPMIWSLSEAPLLESNTLSVHHCLVTQPLAHQPLQIFKIQTLAVKKHL